MSDLPNVENLSPEPQENKPKTIVEIGPNCNPIYDNSGRIREALISGTRYIGIDIRPDDFKYINNEERSNFAVGDLKKLPIADAIADEVWLLNVLGGDFVNSPERLEDGGLRYTLGSSGQFKEMVRVLKPGGIIYIGEWYTRLHEVDWIKEEEYGKYGLTKQIYEGDSLKDFLKQHKMSLSYIHKDTPPFFVALTKKV